MLIVALYLSMDICYQYGLTISSRMRRTLKKLGEGVFGEVFSAYTGDGEGLAIKVNI